MRWPHGHSLVLMALAGIACTAAGRQECQPATKPAGLEIRQLVGDDLLRQANRGRDVIDSRGTFRIPNGVRRVWIDVGAHFMETTREAVTDDAGLAVVAVEPLAHCWPQWPASDRVIGMPVAIHLDRGSMDFHVNAHDQTSSLAPSATGTGIDPLMRTVEVRKVPVLRLEDVLASVPPDLEITYLKTDVQGVDLQVLQSGGDALRRVVRIRAEVINAPLYEGVGGADQRAERDIVEYLEQRGFTFVQDEDVNEIAKGPDGRVEPRAWMDKVFVNTRCFSWTDRLLLRLRYGQEG